MPQTILTQEDFLDFKEELFNELENLFEKCKENGLKEYLKSSEVKKRLKISTNTLKNLRLNGTLPYVKIGGLIFYESDEVQKVMKAHRVKSK